MPNNLTIQQFAAMLKQRDPRLAQYPDDLIVRKVLERRPEMIQFLARADERRPLLEHDAWVAIRDKIQKTMENMGNAAVQRHNNPYVQMLYNKAKQALISQHQQQVQSAHRDIGKLLDISPGLSRTFRPGGPVDIFGRMWTPGAKGPDPEPGEDLFYKNRIREIIKNLK